MTVKLLINKFLHLFEIMRIKEERRIVYLTFDDAPEPGIAEFVLEELSKYDFHATFFCRGDNAEMFPELLKLIRSKGHSIGNHTYSHINSFETRTIDYVLDVEKANIILKTHLFRPPWGSITLSAFLKLRRKYKIVYWSLISGDTEMDRFVLNDSFKKLKKETKAGDIVLFHCCHRHEKETMKILPLYLQWLNDNGYSSEVIN